MRIDFIPSVNDIKEELIKNRTVIIIDVLRATSVITTALYHGASTVVPVMEVEDALRLAGENVLLGGERKALKIPGFDLSNSPLEYSDSVISGKTVVLSTTNGTKAILCSKGSGRRLIGCMLNGRAVAEYAAAAGNDITILCAGTYGRFSLDDFLCGGKIANDVREQRDCESDDLTTAAILAYRTSKGDVLGTVKQAAHYKYLESIGLEEDIHYCFREDRFTNIPEVFENSSGLEIHNVH